MPSRKKKTMPASTSRSKKSKSRVTVGGKVFRPFASLSKTLRIVFVLLIAALGTALLLKAFAATGSTITYNGTLTTKATSASYPLTNTYAGTLTASLSYSGPLKNATLAMYTSTGTLITQSSAGNPITISANVAASTSYKFTVSGSGLKAKQTATYTLTITMPASTTPPPDTTPPSSPTGLTATAASTTQINLSWTASNDNNGGDNIAGYYIYRGTTGTNLIQLTSTASTSYSDINLSPSTTYYYYVKAFDQAGNVSPASTTVSATTQTPADTTPPAVTITNPASGSITSGTLNVTGTASDNVSVSKVEVSVDNNGFVQASGTTSWTYSLNTTLYTNATHTITARATDTSGNATTTQEAITINNSTGTGGTTAPTTQGTWVSPEGVTIEVNSAGTNPYTGKLWTIADVYQLLLNNTAKTGDLSNLAPKLTINLQDTYPSQSGQGCGSSNGVYDSWSGIVSLGGSAGSSFETTPSDIFAHEYGELWGGHYLCIVQQENWNAYLNERWVTADGSVTLATDPNTGNSLAWDPIDLIGDDYRLLFGSSLAISEIQYYWNSQVLDPRQQPGLANWFLTTWR